MFGYIVTNQKALPEERQRRFRALYCGLCRTLRKRHGLAGSATLSYDLTFLAALAAVTGGRTMFRDFF